MNTNQEIATAKVLPTVNNITLPDIIIVCSIIGMTYTTGLIIFKVGGFFNQQKETLNNLTGEIKTLSSTVRHIDESIKSIEDWAVRKGFKRND